MVKVKVIKAFFLGDALHLKGEKTKFAKAKAAELEKRGFVEIEKRELKDDTGKANNFTPTTKKRH